MKKIIYLLTLTISLLLLFCVSSINASYHKTKQTTYLKINKWYNGTPKIIRGTWYHNDKDNENNAYITYGKNTSGGNFFSEYVDENHINLFKKEDPNGLLSIKYRYLGKNTYQIKGVSYDTENNKKKSNHYYYSYKVDILKNRLHFHLGHGVKDYVKHPSFRIVK